MQLTERVGQPERHSAERLYLHDAEVAVEYPLAVVPLAEVEVVGAEAHVAVKGDAQLVVGLAVKGGAVVGDEHLGRDVLVVVHRPVDLAHDLRIVGQHAVFDIALGDGVFQGLAALVDNAVVLLFQLQKDVAACLGCGVAAQAELFFVDRLFHRLTDQAAVGCVKVERANRALAVLVRLDIVVHHLQQSAALAEGEDIFLFGPLKNSLYLHGAVLLSVPFVSMLTV